MTLMHTISPLFWCSSCPIRDHSICGAMIGPQALGELASARSSCRSFTPCDPVYAQGDRVGDAFVVLSGWLQLYQVLEDGRRQIQRFLMPGDLFGAVSASQQDIDHSAEALTQASICVLPTTRLTSLRQRHPTLGNRLLEAVEQTAHEAMDMVTNIGRRSATERVARLLQHCLDEMRRRDLVAPDARGAQLPLTQVTIGDALGLTSIHVNRVLRSLREMQVLSFVRGTLLIHDEVRLDALLHGTEQHDRQGAGFVPDKRMLRTVAAPVGR